MIIEGYNGICPKCGFDRMLVRYGSAGWFQYDACTKCGFAYGVNSEGEYTQDEVWESLIHAHENLFKEKNLPVSREGIHQWILSLPDPGERMKGCGSVFVHKKVED
jgi:hypothetical protein